MADAGELVVRLRAEIAEFQKNFKAAQETIAQFEASATATAAGTAVAFGRMGASTYIPLTRFETGLTNVRKALVGMGAAGAAATASLNRFSGRVLGPIVGFLTLTTAVNKARQGVQDFNDIFVKAQTAGVSTDLFQALGRRADEMGLSIEDVGGALTTFAKNSVQAANGIGRMRTQLAALDPRLLQQIIAAHGDQEKRVRAVADALEGLRKKYGEAGSAALRAAISTAAFSNVDFGRIIEGGAKSLDDMVAAARKMGIPTAEILRKAHDINAEFTLASTILDTQMKEALLNLVGPMTKLLELAGGFTKSLNELPTTLQHITLDLSGAILIPQAVGQEDQIKKIMAGIAEASIPGPMGKVMPPGWLDAQIADLKTLEASYVKTYGDIGQITVALAKSGGAADQAQLDAFVDGVKRKIADTEKYLTKIRADVGAGLLPPQAEQGPQIALQGLFDILARIEKQARAAGLAIAGIPAPLAHPGQNLGQVPTVTTLAPSTAGLVREIINGIGVTRLASSVEKGDAAIVSVMDNTMNVSKAIASGVDASNSSLDSIDTGQGRGFSSVVSALASLGSSLGSSFQTAMAGANGGFTAPPGTYAPSGTTGFAGDVFGTGEIPNPAYTAIQKNVQQAQAELDYLGTVLQYQQVSVSQQQAINLRMAALQLEIAKSNMSLSRMSSILYSNGYYSWVPPGYQDPSLVDTAGHHFTSYATGGAFKVGGSGGQDSQKVSFWASPDETVAVFTPEQWKKQGRYLARMLDEMTTGGPRAKDGTPAYAQGGFYRSGRPANDDRSANASAPVSFFGGINIINTGGSDTRSRFAIEQDFGAMVRRTLRGRV